MTEIPALLGIIPSPPVTFHRLLTGWQFGDWAGDIAFAFVIFGAVVYLWGTRLLAHKGRAWPRMRTAAYLSGLFLLFVALVSGVTFYDDSEFTVHIIQHLIIMMIAPPLLSLGAPVTLILQAYPRPIQSRLARLVQSRGVRILTQPLLAAALYYVSMWVDMQTSFYPYSLNHPLAHDASHFVLFAFGCMFWWPIIATDQLPHRPPVLLRLALVFAGIPFEAFLGISLMSMGTTIAPQHTLADTHRGGSVFWAGTMLIMLLSVIVIAVHWLHQEERAAERIDRRAARTTGVATLPTGATDRERDLWTEHWVARTGRAPDRHPDAQLQEQSKKGLQRS